MNAEETKPTQPSAEAVEPAAAPRSPRGPGRGRGPGGPGGPGGRGPGRGFGGGPGRGPRRSGPPGERADEDSGPQLAEKVVHVNRCAKVVKGGRRFSFSALVVAGDREGSVGYGFGKANEVADAIRKATDSARKELSKYPLKGTTIPHEVWGEFGGGRVLLRPASEGTGIIAGGAVRAVMEAVGISNIRAKCLRSNNPQNVVKATMQGLESLRDAAEVARIRGKSVEEIVG